MSRNMAGLVDDGHRMADLKGQINVPVQSFCSDAGPLGKTVFLLYHFQLQIFGRF